MSDLKFTNKLVKFGLVTAISIALAGCEEGKSPSLFKGSGESGGLFKKKDGDANKTALATTPDGDGSIKLVERDVESPEVFQVTEKALWDGRPSLGGVWVAHPDSDQPERVIIRNKTNGKFVIGALFKRERDNPGPKLQLSSDAANALDVLAGAPTTLNVTALRRETVNVDNGGGSPATPEAVETKVLAPAQTADIESAVLKSVAEAEAEKAGTQKDTKKPAAKLAPAPKVAVVKAETPKVPVPKAPTPKPATTPSLRLPYIQIGFFSVETNARNTMKSLETRKIPGRVLKSSAKGKTFWRVMAGPSQTEGERAAYMKEITKMGFSDAYFSKN